MINGEEAELEGCKCVVPQEPDFVWMARSHMRCG